MDAPDPAGRIDSFGVIGVINGEDIF